MKKNTILGAFCEGFKKGYNDTLNEYKASDKYINQKKELEASKGELKATLAELKKAMNK